MPALAGEEAYPKAVVVTKLMKTGTDAAGQVIEYPKAGTPELQGLLVEIPVGASTGWHVHPSPCIAHVLQGEVTVDLADGRKNSFVAGDTFAEVVKLGHCGRNTGKVPVKIMLFVIGTQGTAVSAPVAK